MRSVDYAVKRSSNHKAKCRHDAQTNYWDGSQVMFG